ncbi:glycosyltransferase family 4 protein [Gramella jeungdoensis]|uniref:Glycosyltransferase family 4 protein n=1 Tax=Gramella jeungdoensis TaxID=708091 RepID=A0ABT0Z0H3_9FLAO|nr:glycosyltransferase family 4 protein [Gramella jeungdoensis]MCM8569223.1 glycosyltransferase family 4 protein [Gramella jeungdoensis]
MRTFFICFSLKNSSVAEFFITLSNKLVRDARVIIISYDDHPHPFEIRPEITVLNWPSGRPTKWKDFIFLADLIRKEKPDTIISNFGAVNLCLLAGYLLRVKNRIAWYHTHSSAHSQEKKILNIRKSLIYRLSTLMITNSMAAKSDLIKHYGVPEDRIEVFPNAVHIPSLLTKCKVNNHKIVYAGRLHPVKGLKVLLEALPRVISNYPDTEVLIFGGNPGSEEILAYKNMARKLGVEGNLAFKGFASRENVLRALAEAYVCVVPSFFEAFCYVVIESFAVSTPVIGSNTTGIAEIIRNGEDGYLFETGNSLELSHCICQIFSDKQKRNEMAQNAHQHFLENYELSNVVNNLTRRLNA